MQFFYQDFGINLQRERKISNALLKGNYGTFPCVKFIMTNHFIRNMDHICTDN